MKIPSMWMCRREGDLEEIPDVLSEEDPAESAGALLVGAIAERRHRGVLPDEGDTSPSR